MKDRIRYSEAFKLKVMEELRDAKWKSVQEAARAYGIAEMSVYNWIHKLGFEHLKGRLIYVKTRTELDRIKELEEQVLRLKQSLADEVLDHKIDVESLKIACANPFRVVGARPHLQGIGQFCYNTRTFVVGG